MVKIRVGLHLRKLSQKQNQYRFLDHSVQKGESKARLDNP